MDWKKIGLGILFIIIIFLATEALLPREGVKSADLRVTDLTVTPTKVLTGETVSISANVKNTGGRESSENIKFIIGESVAKVFNIKISPGENKLIKFGIKKEEEGFYQVEVSNITSRFEALPDKEVGERLENVRIINVFNNYSHNPNLQTSWGFSCLVKTEVMNILFDTGGSGKILLGNMGEMGIDPEKIDVVFLSHIHGDHVGGLKKFLKVNPHVTVYFPGSFPESFKDEIEKTGAEGVKVNSPKRVAPGIQSTGELMGPPKEQSLVISTAEGLAVITGCAHPGIVRTVRRARELENDNLHLVMGGFHLTGVSNEELRSIVRSFRELGVEMVSPTHCSGDRCREIFKEEYGENYLPDGVGSIIQVATGASGEKDFGGNTSRKN